MSRHTSTTGILVILVAALGLLVAYAILSNNRAFFTSPADNKLPNPELTDWTTTPYMLPTGWTTEGWSHGPNWQSLAQSTAPLTSPPYSTGVLGKGYDGNTVLACDNWCRWLTPPAPIQEREIVAARFAFRPQTFARTSSGTDGIRADLVYYAANGSSIGSFQGPILKEPAFATQDWSNITFTSLAPQDAASARIRITLATTPTNQFVTSFYLDDFIIESSLCLENWTCPPWQYCTAGSQVRVCTDNTRCGTVFNRPQTSRSCTGDIFQHIADFKADRQTMPGLMTEIATWRQNYVTDQEWERRYNTIKNDGYYKAEAYLGGEYSNAVASMLDMYEATQNTAYLDAAAVELDWAFGLWPWTCNGAAGCGWGEYETPDRPSLDRYDASNTIENYVRFAYLAQNVSVQQSRKTQYMDFAKNNFLDYWVRDTHNWTEGQEKLSCIESDRTAATGEWFCDRFNVLAHIATSLLYADLVSPNPTYREVADQVARYTKTDGLHREPGCRDNTTQIYSWGYRFFPAVLGAWVPPTTQTSGDAWGQYERGHREENHYAGYVVDMAYVFWKQGRIFTDSDIDLFANLLLEKWNGDDQQPYIYKDAQCWIDFAGPDGHGGYETGIIQGYAHLAEKDAVARRIMEHVASNLYEDGAPTSNWDSNLYKCIQTPNYGTVCVAINKPVGPDEQMRTISNLLLARKNSPVTR